jgi:hypothetical protein
MLIKINGLRSSKVAEREVIDEDAPITIIRNEVDLLILNLILY